MLTVLAEAEAQPEIHVPLAYGAATVILSLGTALVMLYFRWRKGTAELEKMKSELEDAKEKARIANDTAKEAAKIANEQAIADVRRTVVKTDMEVQAQVVAQLTNIIEGYEERFSDFVKQAEEREVQFQEMMNASRSEHLECVRKYERAEARIEMLEQKNATHEQTIKQLNERIEILQQRRR